MLKKIAVLAFVLSLSGCGMSDTEKLKNAKANLAQQIEMLAKKEFGIKPSNWEIVKGSVEIEDKDEDVEFEVQFYFDRLVKSGWILTKTATPKLEVDCGYYKGDKCRITRPFF